MADLSWRGVYDDMSSRWWPTLFDGDLQVAEFMERYSFGDEPACAAFIKAHLPKLRVPDDITDSLAPVREDGVVHPQPLIDVLDPAKNPDLRVYDVEAELEGDPGY